ncbi:MAG TPA: hypothetical protein DDY17_11555 [Syntrophaceae bacterium]|nr:hypothetical protein [Syntrophaceae bacterium]
MNQREVHRNGTRIIVSVYMLTTQKDYRFFSFTKNNIHVASRREKYRCKHMNLTPRQFCDQ